MKIWFDINTPKQLLFLEPMAKKLGKRHKVLCTTRRYREVDHLLKIRKIKMPVIGRHGGDKNSDKLRASIARMKELLPVVERFGPDVTVSCHSTDAARIAYGLKVRHVAFSDAPHSEAVMRLTLPLIQKLLIPWFIPKAAYTKYGIAARDVIPYRSYDAAFIIGQKVFTKTVPKVLKKGTNILFRTYETKAAYAKKDVDLVKIIERLAGIKDVNVIVLGRYADEIEMLERRVGSKAHVLKKAVDSGEILKMVDIFVGSGGTMSTEAALRGVPTFAYNSIYGLSNDTDDYLVKKKLVTRIKRLDDLEGAIIRTINDKSSTVRDRARKEMASLEDPLKKLEAVLGTS